MRRVVIDPGVLVSAALSPSGKPAAIVDAVGRGEVVLVVSPALLAELDDVLARPTIAARLDTAALARLRHVLAAAPAIADPPSVPVSRDPADDYLIALAGRAEADCLVSGDKDLTVLIDVAPPIRTPSAFLEALHP